MECPLHEEMAARRTELADTVVARLANSTAPHYCELDEMVIRMRAERLVEVFVTSLGERPAVFTEYIARIAAERLGEGFALEEIQLALSVLEEKAWQVVVDHVPAAQQVTCLGRVSSTVGAAKDLLARRFLELLRLAERRAAAGDGLFAEP